MGGIGSGRYGGLGRATCEDYRAVYLRKLIRDGMVLPGNACLLRWYRGDQETGSIRVVCSYGEVKLVYRVRPHGGEDWRDMTECVELSYTGQHFGGERAWFLCPHCGRRCAILYGGARFLCRGCHGLGYESQSEDRPNRLLRRSQKLRTRPGGSGDMTEPFPERPKGMHRRTYERLCYQGETMEAAMWGVVMQRFGSFRF